MRGTTTDNRTVSAPGEATTTANRPPTGGVWALPLIALGLGLIACCMVIPASDANRGYVFERERLQAELDGLKRQVAVNQDFLDRIHREPELAERLAERQTHARAADVATLAPPKLNGGGDFAMSPFALVRAEPTPPPAAPSPPAGGRLAAYCRQPRTRLAVLGVGLFLCLLGLLGGGESRALIRDRKAPSPH